MADQMIQQATVVTAAAPNSNQNMIQLALFDATGAPLGVVKKQAAQVDSTATDVPGLKTDFNALLAKLRAAGVIS